MLLLNCNNFGKSILSCVNSHKKLRNIHNLRYCTFVYDLVLFTVSHFVTILKHFTNIIVAM